MQTLRLISLLALGTPLAAQCTIDQLQPDIASDGFGVVISPSNGEVLVGALYDDGDGQHAGAAFLYEYGASGFVRQRIASPAPMQEGLFGQALDLQGDEMVIGSRDNELGTSAGAVWVFERVAGSWVFGDKLLASDGGSLDNFGVTLARDGNRLVVGAPGGGGPGAAYVFEKVQGQWVEVAKLEGAGPESTAYFGQTVAISGSRILVGCAFSGGPFAPGAAYLFEENGGSWSQVQRLVPPGSGYLDLVGSAVALEGDVAVVGAPGRDCCAGDVGAVFLYEWDGSSWPQVDRLDGSVVSNAGFGLSLSLENGRLAVGAPYLLAASAPCYVEVFEREGAGWESTDVLHGTGMRFGFSVKLADGALYAGSETVGGLPTVRRVTLEDEAHLMAGPTRISFGGGESQHLQVSTCPSLAGAPYHVLGSLSGSGTFGVGNGVMVPLGFDDYTRRTILAPGQLMSGATGNLDANGQAAITFHIGSPLLSILVGRTLHHAAVVFDPNGVPILATNGAPVVIEP